MKIKESLEIRLLAAGLGFITGTLIGGIIAIIYDLSTGQYFRYFRWILGLVLGIIGFIVGKKFLIPFFFFIRFIDERFISKGKHVIHTPYHTKEFFINKVIEQAAEEKISLTRTEKEMLDWEDLDARYPEYWNVELGQRFEKEVDKEDYEEKISMLLRRAYKQDAKKDRNAQKAYRNAYLAIKDGSSYISILAEKGLAAYVAPWKYFLGFTYK